jgi:hypothetical protein
MPPSKSNKKGAAATQAPKEETAVVDAVPPPKKKGANKKPVKVVAIVTPQGIEGSFHAEPRRPLIVHLGIRMNDISFGDTAAGSEPEPYDASTRDVFSEAQEHLEGLGATPAPATPISTSASTRVAAAPVDTASEIVKPMPCFTKMNLMVQFKNVHDAKVLPDKTNIACFWCVHPFDHQPCIIPEREVNGVYNVYGNFCSPECGVAYLLKEGLDPHVRWERMALLHRVYDRQGIGQIFPAPARECLTVFGGPMSIDVFRATLLSKKVRVDLHMPPMVSILGSIDTKPIDFFDSTSRHAGLPVLPQRSVEEGLRLKRNKPLKDKESTLDTVMNIKIGAHHSAGLSRG